MTALSEVEGPHSPNSLISQPRHRMSLIELVRRTLTQYQLAGPSTRVMVALSGGPDSMALLHLLRELHHAGELMLAGIAHLNHQLRARADADEEFCADVAARFQLPFFSERSDVRAVALREHGSIEAAAHTLRYDFFGRVLAAQGADVMALGHTRDDQAETFLLRLIRGAGSRGLAAMYPRSGSVIRPLLESARADVHAFLAEAGVDFIRDESNEDVSIPRNRVRTELLPLLAQRFNPRIVEALSGAAVLARFDEELIKELVDAWLKQHATCVASGAWQVPIQALTNTPRAVSFRALHHLMQETSGRHIGLEDVRRAWSVVAGEHPAVDAPGHRVKRETGFVVLTRRPAGSAGRRPAVPTEAIPGFCRPLPVPGEVALPEISCVMSAEISDSAPGPSQPNGLMALVPKKMVAGGLAVRNRRPGDRLRPGRAGHRKLQDLFVDRKVPRAERDRVPIVTTADGRIVWVAGHALDEDFRVVDPVQAVVILRLKGVGGSC